MHSRAARMEVWDGSEVMDCTAFRDSNVVSAFDSPVPRPLLCNVLREAVFTRSAPCEYRETERGSGSEAMTEDESQRLAPSIGAF